MGQFVMKESESFKFIGETPSFDSLLTQISLLSEDDWTQYRERRLRGGAAAEQTDTIPLIYDLAQNINSNIIHEKYGIFNPYMDAVMELVSESLGTLSIKQAMLTRLRSGSVIGRHRDRGPLTAKTHRIHVPVITNEQCLFTVDDEVRNLQAGEVWIIDNVGRYHSVENKGQQDRVHLIIDAM